MAAPGTSTPDLPVGGSAAGAPLALPSISLPKGGGAIRGIGETFTADPATGTGSMSVPIPTSPGRSGFGPQLALSYDSGRGNGPFGFGWSLSSPSVTRKTELGLLRYDEADVFVLSGVEDLVPVRAAEGSARPGTGPPAGYRVDWFRPRIEGRERHADPGEQLSADQRGAAGLRLRPGRGGRRAVQRPFRWGPVDGDQPRQPGHRDVRDQPAG